jgi:hypothetical protein
MNNSLLNERLERMALQYLVAPLVSIDEYESKIDDQRVIVTAFHVKDLDPAKDLSSFIEKSSIRPLDTETSPAPTDEGWYMVFVEMGRNKEYPERIIELVKQINNLTDIKDWQFKPYAGDENEFYPLTVDNIRDKIILEPKEIHTLDEPSKDDKESTSDEEIKIDGADQPALENIGSFFKNAMVESVEQRRDWIRINSNGLNKVYKITAFGQGQGSIPVFGLDIGNETLRESRLLESMLGPSYSVECADGYVCINHDNQHLILAAY